ncbi:MAG: NAD(P)-dependent oxidoreductase [bacterium]|nr:NAD(P)-dependent oxidoreductase [bacterium]
MNLKGKKILVTGGHGFIGQYLIKRLILKESKVDVFDISNGLDITNAEQLKSFVKKKYDIIYHLAGFSGSAESNQEKLKCLNINLLSTVNLFELILKYSPKTKIILSSSRLEYGPPKYLPIDELHPTEPTSMYGLTKLNSTQMAMIYRDQFNLDVTVMRTSNVYGPHSNKKFAGYNVVNHFINLAKKGKTLTIYGDGKQKRDYIYIDDFVDVLILATSKKASGKIYNLGLSKGVVFREMAELIVKAVGKGSIKFVKWPEGYEQVETGSYVSDITKIKKDLGFNPKISFEEGILKTIENENCFFEKKRDLNLW